MKIVDILTEDLVVPDLRATTRDAALQEIVDHVASLVSAIDRAWALRVLLERERIASTGVGNGFAIPHAKLPNLPGVVGCFARSAPGVIFGSLDGHPAHLFLALFSPEAGAGIHLKALARASRLFKDPAFRTRLLGLPDRRTLWTTICAEDLRFAQGEG